MKYLSIVLSLIILIGCSSVEERELETEVAAVGHKATDDTPEQKAMDAERQRKARVKALVEQLGAASLEMRLAAYYELENEVVRKRDIPYLKIESARHANPELTENLQKLINFMEGKWRLPDGRWTEFFFHELYDYEDEFKKYNTSVELSHQFKGQGWPYCELVFLNFPDDLEDQLGVIKLILTLDPEMIKLSKDFKNLSFIYSLNILANLKELNLESTMLVDLAPLEGMPNLTVINLKNTKVTDLTPLESLTNLERLNLENTKVADLSPLEDLTNIYFLNLNGTQVTDLSPLMSLEKLRILNLQKTRISDLTPLEGLANLHALELNNTRVSDLAPLNGLTNLLLLNLESTMVADLTPLKSVTNLHVLNLENTKVSDLTPLKGLINLFSLNLRATQVADLTPLKKLVKLRHLYLDRTKFVDITPLEGMSVNIYGHE